MKDQSMQYHTVCVNSLQVCRSFIENLRLYLAGRPLQHQVDWTREY